MYEMVKKDVRSNSVHTQKKVGGDYNKKSQTNRCLQIVPVIQLQPEKLKDKVKRALERCGLVYMEGSELGPDYRAGDARGIMFNDSDIEYLVEKLESNNHPRVRGKRLELVLDSIGRVKKRKIFYSGEGMMGRVSRENLDLAMESILVDRVPDRAEWSCTIEREIKALQELISVGERHGLSSVMGKSAFELTGIENAEYLHIIGHQLGGKDEPGNLCAGSHALNTAMIPIEHLVRQLQGERRKGSYQVKFYVGRMKNALTGELFNWVYSVNITLTLDNLPEPAIKKEWTIIEPGDIEKYIHEKQIEEIQESVGEFKELL